MKQPPVKPHGHARPPRCSPEAGRGGTFDDHASRGRHPAHAKEFSPTTMAVATGGVGSYEEARLFALKAFQRLTPAQKLRWLSDMTAFINEANPNVRLRRLEWRGKRVMRRR